MTDDELRVGMTESQLRKYFAKRRQLFGEIPHPYTHDGVHVFVSQDARFPELDTERDRWYRTLPPTSICEREYRLMLQFRPALSAIELIYALEKAGHIGYWAQLAIEPDLDCDSRELLHILQRGWREILGGFARTMLQRLVPPVAQTIELFIVSPRRLGFNVHPSIAALLDARHREEWSRQLLSVHEQLLPVPGIVPPHLFLTSRRMCAEGILPSARMLFAMESIPVGIRRQSGRQADDPDIKTIHNLVYELVAGEAPYLDAHVINEMSFDIPVGEEFFIDVDMPVVFAIGLRPPSH